jgi:AcrR family transcriptional regulator
MNAGSRNEATVQPLRSRFKEVTRGAILEAAEAVFSERGFHGAHMGEIASRAGVAVGTLYNYFEDREHLLGALLDAYGEELRAKLAATLEGRMPFRERLEAFLRAVVLHLQSHWRLFAILVEDELVHARGGARPSQRRPMLREVYEASEELVALGVRQGALRRDSKDLFPALLTGVIRGSFTHQLYTERGAPLERHIPALIRFFLEGAGAAP